MARGRLESTLPLCMHISYLGCGDGYHLAYLHHNRVWRKAAPAMNEITKISIPWIAMQISKIIKKNVNTILHPYLLALVLMKIISSAAALCSCGNTASGSRAGSGSILQRGLTPPFIVWCRHTHRNTYKIMSDSIFCAKSG